MCFYVSRHSTTSRLIACGTQLALINLTALAFTGDKWGQFNRPSVATYGSANGVQGCKKMVTSASCHVVVRKEMTQNWLVEFERMFSESRVFQKFNEF